jgi:bifunctional non-homologous end joining protein LigD
MAGIKKARSKKLKDSTFGGLKTGDYIPAMLAKETNKPFSDNKWVYEMKWDGFRAISELDGSEVELYSRNGNSFNHAYPAVYNALKKLNLNAVLDGEIIVLNENGQPDFQKLQLYRSVGGYAIEYRVFDILYLNGNNLCSRPLIERKKLLKSALPENDVVKYSDHILGEGERFFSLAVEKDLEGIIAKSAESTYMPGARTSSWLKIKNHKSQEAIICGFTQPTGSRKYFGALVLGIYNGNELRYAGHSGSGFNQVTLREVYAQLEPLITSRSPFATKIKTNATVTWIKPKLVCEIKFSEWTRDGLMRHPIFLRMRKDKKPSDVTISAVKPIAPPDKTEEPAAKKSGPKNNGEKKTGEERKIGRVKVRLTNASKIFWPEEKITKGAVIDYYQEVAKYILPFLKNRPQSLKRTPNGIYDSGFFHKNAGDEAPAWVKTKTFYSESASRDIDYILCNDAATLAYMNNLGCIEINPWHSTVQHPDHPDYIIIDIDPADKNTFEQVIETAHVVHEVLEEAGVASYCKTSGATGLHVYIPAKHKYTYDQVKDFSELVCMITQQRLPKFTSMERNLKKRGNNMIYLDHLQNRRGQTISCVYSLRPKPGAPVSMPLEWKELKKGLHPADFNIRNALKRIQKKPQQFTEVLGSGFNLLKALRSLDKK